MAIVFRCFVRLTQTALNNCWSASESAKADGVESLAMAISWIGGSTPKRSRLPRIACYGVPEPNAAVTVPPLVADRVHVLVGNQNERK